MNLKNKYNFMIEFTIMEIKYYLQERKVGKNNLIIQFTEFE